MSKVTEQSTSKETGDSIKDVNRAWHDARDDAAKEGGHGVPADRHGGGLGGKIATAIGNILKGGSDPE